jgi:transposase
MRVATIGLDIAKTIFQVHGIDAAGQVVVRQRLARRRVLAFFEKLAPCLIGIEACSTSHYWARELIARGHEVRLIPAQYVKPYVKRGKNGAADAEAIPVQAGDKPARPCPGPRCALCPSRRQSSKA